MATVTVYTAARMQAIENASIVSGTVNQNGQLILTKHDNSTVNAGSVIGPQGPQGPMGEVTEAEMNAAISAALGVGAITQTMLADGSVSVTKIGTGAVTEIKIATDAITSDKISANAVTETKIASNAVTSSKILNANVTNDKLATNAVTSDKIASNAVIDSKVSTGISASKIAGIYYRSGSSGQHQIIISTSAPSGGSHGDIWLRY